MARIRPLEGREAPLMLHVFNWLSRRMYGQEMASARIIAHNPRFLLGSLGMGIFSGGPSKLDPRTRLLAMHLAAEINGCAWCLDFGAYMGARGGVPAEKLAAVGEYATSPVFTPAERAALAYADAMTQVGGHVPDDVFANVRRHYSEREIVELTVAVAAENFYNRGNAALGVEAQGFCALPMPPVTAKTARTSPVPRFVRVANVATTVLLRAGVRLVGFGRLPTYLLTVRGRTSGQPRTTPITVIPQGGERYVLAPYGAVDWVRNLRAAGEATLTRGRRGEGVRATELPAAEAGRVLRAFIESGNPIGRAFGVTAASSREEFERAAATHPVFLLRRAESAGREARTDAATAAAPGA